MTPTTRHTLVDEQLIAATLAASDLQARGLRIIAIDIDARRDEAQILIADPGAELDDLDVPRGMQLHGGARTCFIRLHAALVKWVLRYAQPAETAAAAREADLEADRQAEADAGLQARFERHCGEV